MIKYLMLIFSFFVVFTLFSEESFVERVSKIETMLYGQKRINESLDTRIARVEKILFGKSYPENNIETRIKRIENPFSLKKNGTLNLMEKINYLEWKLKKRVFSLPVLTKLSNLKKIVLGESALKDPVLFEISKLMAVVFGDTRLKNEMVQINNKIELKVELKQALSSRFSRKNQKFEMEISKDVTFKGNLIFPSGAIVKGHVSYAKKAGFFGKNGRLKLALDEIEGIDGNFYKIKLEKLSMAEEENRGVAAGVSLLGLAAFGPVGAVGGIFVRGKNVNLPEGTTFNIKIEFSNPIPSIKELKK